MHTHTHIQPIVCLWRSEGNHRALYCVGYGTKLNVSLLWLSDMSLYLLSHIVFQELFYGKLRVYFQPSSVSAV